ncbi:MAG: hypothetical protein KA191_18070 [Verrucomicrobia bacterium]|jgi:hypothetical protein|nr:hypothetical protein [Verrucomicrobiota bacterium]
MVELVAVRDGFYHGARVRRGERFSFDESEMVQARDRMTGKPLEKDGKPVLVKVKQPRWGKPRAEAAQVIAAEESRRVVVDTKPLAAAAAAKRRAVAE